MLNCGKAQIQPLSAARYNDKIGVGWTTFYVRQEKNIAKMSLDLNPQGKQKRGRTKLTGSRDIKWKFRTSSLNGLK